MTDDEKVAAQLPIFAELTQNLAAAHFLGKCQRLFYAADDIADGDADAQSSMAAVLRMAAVELPADPFYQANFAVLAPMIGSCVTQWEISNRFHRGSERQQAFGFVLRFSPLLLVMEVAALCRGWEAAADAYEAVFHAAFHDDAETLADWIGEAE